MADLRAPTPSGAAELVAEETLSMVRALVTQKNRLIQIMEVKIDKNREILTRMKKEILRFRPKERIEEMRLHLDVINDRMIRALNSRIKNERQQLINVKTRIEAMSPVNVLKKGYVRVTDNNGSPIVAVTGLTVDQLVTLHFADGEAEANIQSTKENK